jgi:hypothetical protein
VIAAFEGGAKDSGEMTKIRKLVVNYEETLEEMGRDVDPSVRKAVAAAVISNPFAATYDNDLASLVDLGAELGGLLAERVLSALSIEAGDVDAYGKGAIVGLDGELEHAAAVLHPRFGAPVRAVVDGTELIPATKKVGAAGSSLAMPLAGKRDLWNFDYWDSTEIAVPDAPRANEILVCLGVASGGRPLHRVQPAR